MTKLWDRHAAAQTMPDIGVGPFVRDEFIARHIAATSSRGQHSQMCGVWLSGDTLDGCDCWVLQRGRTMALVAVTAYEGWDVL
jgi:hypothetical protein